jgi:alkylation response protein AidB-like acyl-CoA dehydrogenase
MSFDLTQTEDQRQILDAVHALLAESYPVSRLSDARAADDLTPLIAFGAFALALPEQSGGTGFTLIEEALVHVQLGRHLVSLTALAAPIAARISYETGRSDILTGIVDGTITVAPAVRHEDGILLLDGEAADLAVFRSGANLHLVDLARVERHSEPSMGQGRPITKVALEQSSNVLTAAAETAAIEQVLIAAQLLGIAEGTRDLAVEYASLREQFGRPIGSFQAIKHHCANMAIRAERLSAQLDMAAIAVHEGRDDADFQVAALARIVPDIALENARTCIQIHGGIGFSAEADAHLYLKQAHALAQLCDRGRLLSHASPMAPTRKET